MNEKELIKWMLSAKKVGSERFEYDDHGNERGSFIYSKDDKLYRVSFLNGYPDPVWGHKGWIKDTYEPEEVFEIKRMVEVTEYEPVKPKLDAFGDIKPRDRCCSCHISPPCSYCTDGGYCKEHDCMRNDCGCEK